jgi:hypothetical protein
MLLAFAAEQRLIEAAHAQTLLRVSADSASRRLRSLTAAGYLRVDRQLGAPVYLIERKGLRAIESDLPRPRDPDPGTRRHDAGLAWLWLVASGGAFGAAAAVVSERRMRSQDRRREPLAEPFGVQAPGLGPDGHERLHYPDLLLETEGGHRVAFELELSGKGPLRREQILGSYAVDPRIDAVVYLVTDRRIGSAIEASAAALGISELIRVARVSFGAHPHGMVPAHSSAARPPQGRELGR